MGDTCFNATECCPGLNLPPFISTTISSSVRPCTLCIVVAHANVSGNCKRVISEPHFPLAKNKF